MSVVSFYKMQSCRNMENDLHYNRIHMQRRLASHIVIA